MNFLVKRLLNAIGTDTIKSSADELISEAIRWADSQPLEPGECRVVGMIYHNTGVPYFAACAVTEDLRIVRYIVDRPLSEVIELLFSNIG